jgi:bile acid:Na+ symporter, BASS family
MKLLLQAAVIMLMLSVGMSLDLRTVISKWRDLTVSRWLRLLLATFIIPPVLALFLSHLFHLGLPATAGLFLVGIAPGAPLMTRNALKRGFDMHMAASYQIWSAAMVPIVIPLMVYAGGKLYERELWIPPGKLLIIVLQKQLLPLLGGVALKFVASKWSDKIQWILNLIGNAVISVMLLAILWKLLPTVANAGFGILLAALLLAAGCLTVGLVLLGAGSAVFRTLIICNVNRHVGLALLLSGTYFNASGALPAIACYALGAVLVMTVYSRLVRQTA